MTVACTPRGLLGQFPRLDYGTCIAGTIDQARAGQHGFGDSPHAVHDPLADGPELDAQALEKTAANFCLTVSSSGRRRYRCVNRQSALDLDREEIENWLMPIMLPPKGQTVFRPGHTTTLEKLRSILRSLVERQQDADQSRLSLGLSNLYLASNFVHIALPEKVQIALFDISQIAKFDTVAAACDLTPPRLKRAGDQRQSKPPALSTNALDPQGNGSNPLAALRRNLGVLYLQTREAVSPDDLESRVQNRRQNDLAGLGLGHVVVDNHAIPQGCYSVHPCALAYQDVLTVDATPGTNAETFTPPLVRRSKSIADSGLSDDL